MEVGVFIFATGYSIRTDELATALEERGFESLWVPEHTHIPTSRLSPFPGGGELPREYKSTLDPFVSLSFAAAVTKTLKIGTGICLLPQRDPIVTAKAVASLDQMSGGRFMFGLGGGWNVEEMNNHGAQYKTRFKLLEERVMAMKALWTEEEAAYHGDFVNFDAAWAEPKPYQQPHPPILLGGETDYTLDRVCRFCDGWFPRARGGFDPAVEMGRFRAAAEKAGRDASQMSASVFGTPPKPEVLESYREAGITRAILPLPPVASDEILPRLDRYAELLK